MSRNAILAAALAAVFATGLAGTASAQGTGAPTVPVQPQPRDSNMPAQGNTLPEKIERPGSGGGTLSDKLERSGGVVQPAPGVDPQMVTRTPDPGAGSMPVIRPPGSPGGDPTVQPK